MSDVHEQSETVPQEAVEDGGERRARPHSRPGPTLRNAGFDTFRELAAAVPCVHELISNVRNGNRPMSANLRRRLSEVLCIEEEEVMAALTEGPSEDPDARTPELDAHRECLFSVLAARIEVLVDEEAEDDQLPSRPGPLVPFEEWTEVARAVGCSVRTLIRLRSGSDIPTDYMIERLSRALLVPPELVLVALRRRHTGWVW